MAVLAPSLARKHLEWTAERALEYYDMGDRTSAVSSFVSDVGKHEGTAWITNLPLLMQLLITEYDRGRESFERFLLGFNVV